MSALVYGSGRPVNVRGIPVSPDDLDDGDDIDACTPVSPDDLDDGDGIDACMEDGSRVRIVGWQRAQCGGDMAGTSHREIWYYTVQDVRPGLYAVLAAFPTCLHAEEKRRKAAGLPYRRWLVAAQTLAFLAWDDPEWQAEVERYGWESILQRK